MARGLNFARISIRLCNKFSSIEGEGGNRSAAPSPLVSMRESPGFALRRERGGGRGHKSELKRRSLTAIYKAVVPSPPSGCAPINGIPRRRWRPFVRINSTKGSRRSCFLLVALTGKLIPREKLREHSMQLYRSGWAKLRNQEVVTLSLDFFGGEVERLYILFLFFFFLFFAID